MSSAILAFDAQVQGLEPASDQEGRMWIEHTAEYAAGLAQERDEVLGARHDAAEHVIVTAQVFGGAVHDEIDAEAQRPTVDRRGKSGVHHRLDAPVAPHDRGDLLEVHTV